MSSPETSTRDGISENGAQGAWILMPCIIAVLVFSFIGPAVPRFSEETPHQPHPALSPSQA